MGALHTWNSCVWQKRNACVSVPACDKLAFLVSSAARSIVRQGISSTSDTDSSQYLVTDKGSLVAVKHLIVLTDFTSYTLA